MSLFMSVFYDRFMRKTEEACLHEWRRELLSGLVGAVLEIGAGTGANIAFYPSAVSRLVLSDPDPALVTKLRARSEQRPGVEVVRAPASDLPFPDSSFDAVVSTLVLCSVPDVEQTLTEVRRVLRPGGAFVYLEHVAAKSGSSRLGWQRRIEPLWKHLAGNCHLTRRTGETIRRAGFVVEGEQQASMRKALPIVRPTIRGVARVPA